MKQKTFIFFMAVLFSSVSFAQQFFTVEKSIAFDQQATVRTLVKQNSIGNAVASGQQSTSTPSRANKARAKASEVVTPPNSGDAEIYTLTGTAVVQQHSVSVSRQIEVVRDDQDENIVYIQGLSYYLPNAFVVGTFNSAGDKVTFSAGQYMGSGYGVDFYFGGYGDGSALADVVADYNKNVGSFTFSDYLMDNSEPTSIAFYAYYRPGLTIVPYDGKPENPVEIPKDLLIEKYVYLAFDYFDETSVSRIVNVGFNGNDVYVQGISEFLPSAWIKGTLDGDVISFATGQYLGQYGNQDLWFIGYNMHIGFCDYTMTYDRENFTLSNSSEEELIGVNMYRDKDQRSLYELYHTVAIKKIIEKAAVPTAPSIDHMAFTYYGDMIEFSIPILDVDGDGLVTDKLFYKLYYDEGDGEAKEVTFTAEGYEYLTEDMIAIPYGFTDGRDIYASSVYLRMNHNTWTRIGIQSIYTGGGETNASEINWYTPAWPQVVELPEGAEVSSYSFIGNYYGNTDFSKEVQVAKVGDDVYIQGVGTRNDKTWIKGTKNAETGVYNFPKGQYLGLYDAGQTYYCLFLMGYSHMLGVLDVEMTYDEESNIFTTTTELVENANYVDKLYSLNRVNVGAQIKPIPKLVTGITLSQTSLSLTIGAAQTLTATILPEDAENKNVTWSSSNNNIATVDQSGKVTAKASGSCVITCAAQDGSGVKAECAVTVVRLVTSITLSKTSLSLTVGAALALTATILPNDATNKSVTWSSSNEGIATVDQTGKVTAKAIGSCTIICAAQDGSGVKAECAVTVVEVETEGYPIDMVKWDNVSLENREIIEQLFAEMTLVPEGSEVKKFYISTHEVQQDLWAVLMPNEEAKVDSIVIDSLLTIEEPAVDNPSDTLKKDTANVADIQTFISLLRKQTGKRFRLPTDAERLWAARCQLIDTIADTANTLGKGFYLALDTIGKAEPKMLVITLMDGTQTKYLLDEMPRVSIEKPYLKISAEHASVSFPLEQMKHIHYEKATDEATAIEEIKMFDERGSRERVDFSSLPAGSKVSIYTLDGKLLYNTHSTPGKTLSLPLNSLQSGIYLVKVNDVTYKIQKP